VTASQKIATLLLAISKAIDDCEGKHGTFTIGEMLDALLHMISTVIASDPAFEGRQLALRNLREVMPELAKITEERATSLPGILQ
jgi:hypothetical protein